MVFLFNWVIFRFNMLVVQGGYASIQEIFNWKRSIPIIRVRPVWLGVGLQRCTLRPVCFGWPKDITWQWQCQVHTWPGSTAWRVATLQYKITWKITEYIIGKNTTRTKCLEFCFDAAWNLQGYIGFQICICWPKLSTKVESPQTPRDAMEKRVRILVIPTNYRDTRERCKESLNKNWPPKNTNSCGRNWIIFCMCIYT